MNTDALVAELRGVLGAAHVITDPEVRAGYETDWTGRYSGPACCVVRPGSTDEVVGRDARVRRRRRRRSFRRVATPGWSVAACPAVGEVVLSTRRLDVGRARSTADHGEVVVGAGATLGAVRDRGARGGWDVGVDLASRDSATVGGMVATNAGGEHVAPVRPDAQPACSASRRSSPTGASSGACPRCARTTRGTTGRGCSRDRKGTLGVITRVHLALVPGPPRARRRARRPRRLRGRGVRSPGCSSARLASLLALEVFFADGLERVVPSTPGCRRRSPTTGRSYLLVEVAPVARRRRRCVSELAEVLDGDATTCGRPRSPPTSAGRSRLWAYRDRHTEAINAAGVPHKLDVTLPHDRLEEFVGARARPSSAAIAPEAELVLFGHVGDGNLHVNVLGLDPDDDHGRPRGARGSSRRWAGASAPSTASASRSGASSRSAGAKPTSTRCGALKRALDPTGIMNPGVLLPERPDRRRRSRARPAVTSRRRGRSSAG